MKSQKKNDGELFRMTLNKRQLRAIMVAMEEYFRIRMNQWGDVADCLAGMGVDFSKENPLHDQIFDRYIHRRDSCRSVLETAGRIAMENQVCNKTEEMLVAEDIWGVIRHELWKMERNHPLHTVDAYPPLHCSDEPFVKIEKDEHKR